MVAIGQTEAQKRAHKKYIEKTYKRYAINVRTDFAKIIDEKCTSLGISNSKIFYNAVKYCIENNIELSDDKE